MLTHRKSCAVARLLLLAAGALATSTLTTACSSDPFYASAAAGGAGGGGGAGGHGGDTSSPSVVTVGVTSATASSSTGVLTSSCVVQTVDWYKADVAVADVIVAAHDGTGELVYTTKTDSTGQANVTFPADGSVSVYTSTYVVDEIHYVQTYITPPDGSVLRVFVSDETASGGTATTYNVVAQGFPAGTTNFAFQGHCSSQSSGVSSAILTNANCTALPTEEFLVTAKDQNQTLLAWGQAAAPTSPGVTLDVPVMVSNTNFHTVTGTITDLPATTDDAGLDIRGLVEPYDLFQDTVNGVYPSFSMTGSVAALPIERTVGVFARPEKVGLYWTYFSSFARYDVLPSAFSASLNDIAHITGSSLDTSDPTRPTITWSTDGGPSPDMGFVSHNWMLGTVYFSWSAFFPGNHPTSVTFPRAPIEAQGFAPSSLVVHGDTDVDLYRGLDYASWFAGQFIPLGGARLTTFARRLYPAP